MTKLKQDKRNEKKKYTNKIQANSDRKKTVHLLMKIDPGTWKL